MSVPLIKTATAAASDATAAATNAAELNVRVIAGRFDISPSARVEIRTLWPLSPVAGR